MAVLGTTVPTLADIAASMGADGTFDTDRVNLLSQTNEMIQDMVWKEGNLPTGHKTTLITGLPTVGFRRFNEGVPLSKSTGASIEEGSAMLEGFFQVDRGLAVMSGDVNQYRLDESGLFMEAMNQTLQTYLLYGNASTMPESFTGFAARSDALLGQLDAAPGFRNPRFAAPVTRGPRDPADRFQVALTLVAPERAVAAEAPLTGPARLAESRP